MATNWSVVMTSAGGAALVGSANEASALWRDGRIGGGGDLVMREKTYIAVTGAALVGIPLAAALASGGLGTLAEGAFDGLAAIIARNVAAAVLRTTPPDHTPL